MPQTHDFPLPPELEPLHKVLPAGVPLVATHWTCPTCGLSVRGCPARTCMDDCNPDCPIGGDK